MIVALIPAHNEETALAAAIRSLFNQTTPPDEIVVVADNCTDDTLAIALDHGALAFETGGNTDKKAGALNQALAWWLPSLRERDFVFVMDADGELDPGFLENALRYMSQDVDLGAVGGTFRGMPGGGLVGHFQRNEFARYARDVRRLGGKCLVVTGTAALIRVSAARAVVRAREDGTLPTVPVEERFYNKTEVTESGCFAGRAWTEAVMPSVSLGLYDTRVLTED